MKYSLNLKLDLDYFEGEDHSLSMLPPKVREAMKLSRPEEFRREPGRVLLLILLLNISIAKINYYLFLSLSIGVKLARIRINNRNKLVVLWGLLCLSIQ